MKAMTLFADERGTGLRYDGELDDVDPHTLGISAATRYRLASWQHEYLKYYDLDETRWDAQIETIGHHETVGLELAKVLQSELGSLFRISFFSQIKGARIEP